jgi:hypothetical protein
MSLAQTQVRLNWVLWPRTHQAEAQFRMRRRGEASSGAA